MRGDLQSLQGIDIQGLVNCPRRLRPDAGNRLKDFLRIGFAAHPLQLRPSPRGGHLVDGAGELLADVRELDQAGQTFPRQDLRGLFREPKEGFRGHPVGAHAKAVRFLSLKKLGRFVQPIRDLFS